MLMGACCTCERRLRLGLASAAMLAALALSACASVPAGSPPRVELYRARGDSWRLRIFNTGVNLDERVGPLRWDRWGGLPAAQTGDGVVRFEGSVVFTDVVAGEAVDSTVAYRLEIRTEPCRDRRGRMQPTSVLIDYGPPESQDHGCGGPLPASWPPPTPG